MRGVGEESCAQIELFELCELIGAQLDVLRVVKQQRLCALDLRTAHRKLGQRHVLRNELRTALRAEAMRTSR